MTCILPGPAASDPSHPPPSHCLRPAPNTCSRLLITSCRPLPSLPIPCSPSLTSTFLAPTHRVKSVIAFKGHACPLGLLLLFHILLLTRHISMFFFLPNLRWFLSETFFLFQIEALLSFRLSSIFCLFVRQKNISLC